MYLYLAVKDTVDKLWAQLHYFPHSFLTKIKKRKEIKRDVVSLNVWRP